MHTEFGKKYLKEHPGTVGSLGVAITEACEVASKDPGTCYSLGSVLNHVMLHQTVIGLEAMEQMKKAEIEPDMMIACAGGGSNFGGFCFPMMGRRSKAARNASSSRPSPRPPPASRRGISSMT